MRLRISVDEVDRGTHQDVTVFAEPGTPTSQVLGAISHASGVTGPLCNDQGQLPQEVPLDAAALHDGAILGVGRPGTPIRDAISTGLEIRVVGGPAAGRVFRIGPGRYVIGRRQDCDIPISDPELSREHAAIAVSANGDITISDLGSSNGTVVEGNSVSNTSAPLRSGQVVSVGSTFISVNDVDPLDGDLTDDGQGGYVFNRRYRIRRPATSAHIEFPTLPPEPDKASFPWVMMVAPLVLAGALYFFTKPHQTTFLLFAALSPIMVVGSQMNDRKTRKRKKARAETEFTRDSDSANQELRDFLETERDRRRVDAPDPALLALTAMGPRARLWERRVTDADHLSLRLGLSNLSSAVELVNHRDPPDAWAVPVVVPLLQAGILGIAAAHPFDRSVARNLLLQISVLHSPDDVQIVVLTDEHSKNDWSWLRWLPHSQLDAERGITAIGNDADTLDARVKEVRHLITTRADGQQFGGSRSTALPHVVVVIDGAKRLRTLPGMLSILRHGPDQGVVCIALDADRSLLPEECGAVVTFDASMGLATFERHGEVPTTDITLDEVTRELIETTARSLASIHRIGGDEGGGLPPNARLLEMAGLDPVTQEAITSTWSQPGRRPRALLGAAEHGSLYLDLASDGPHGLVAGTTGAGKSELLQTLVGSLAISTPPDELNFVLVDYKGGAAFRDCSKLPHTVGMVTDLDGHLTERALRSLRAELKRREHVLSASGCKDIGDYLELRARAGSGLEALPRLVIVIDEFASLALELPDFIKGLVGIAQLGRALGVHLILATQRPSGVVSPEIRANLNFAIALRVVNSTESSDIIGRPDAATISPATPGRAYLRVSQEQPVCFQTARVGGRRPGVVSTETVPVAFISDWLNLGRPDPVRAINTVVSEDETDLHALVGSIQAAAELANISPQRQPWLDPLPEVLALDDLPPIPAGQSREVLPVPFGLFDLPDVQTQIPATFDPGLSRHLLMAGSPRTGRSTLLRTLAASMARTCSIDDVHLYGVDCGNGALLAIRDLPHCGAVAARTESDRVERLLGRLGREVKRRQAELIERGLTHADEQRHQPGDDAPWPYIVLLLDGWEGFLEAYHDHKDGAVEQLLMTILREGGAVGVTVIMTGDRGAISTSRISSLFEDRFVLRFNDRDDYSLANLIPRKMPDHVVSGRAYRAVSGEELQIALLVNDPSGRAQSDALAELVAANRERAVTAPPRTRPFRVDSVPTRVTIREAQALGPPPPGSQLRILVGVGGDELVPWWVDLANHGPGFVITGPPESGKSTSLQTIGSTLSDQGCQVVVVAPRISPVTELRGKPGVHVVSEAAVSALTADALKEMVGPAGPRVILVDDAELVDPDTSWLVEAAAGGSGPNAVVIAGGLEPLRDCFRGFPLAVKRSALGLLLSPRSHLDASIFNATLTRGTNFTGPPGRAYFFHRGRVLALVQIPQN